MDILLGLFVGFLMFVLPFLLAGGVVFCGVFFVGFVLSRFATRASKLRKNIVLVSLILGSILGVLLSIPLVAYTYTHLFGKKEHVAENFDTAFREQQKRDGRDKYWSAGTLADLDYWINQADINFRAGAHRNLAGVLASFIEKNKIATNDRDLEIITSLANLPAKSNGYSDGVIASARAYLRIKDIGYGDLGHPERFARSLGHHDFAAQMDYVAYLRLLMQRCVDAPGAKCREVFSPDYLAGLERVPYYPLDWLELRESLPPLRAALGYPAGKQDH